jgi:hypothetical protein
VKWTGFPWHASALSVDLVGDLPWNESDECAPVSLRREK